MVRQPNFEGPLGDLRGALQPTDVGVGDVGEGSFKIVKLLSEARTILLRSQGVKAGTPEADKLVTESIKIAPNGQVVFIGDLQIDPDNLSRIGILQQQIRGLVDKGVEIPEQFLISDEEAVILERRKE